MIYVKKNISQESEILAVCDEDLIGKTFKEDNLKLEITERFYKGDLVKNDEAISLMRKAKSINIAGKTSIKLALDSGIIEKENIIKIKNIPHAIIFEL